MIPRLRVRVGIHLATAVCLAAVCVARPTPAAAQTAPQRFALLVEGPPGDQPHADAQRKILQAMIDKCRGDYHLDAAHLIVLASTPAAGEGKSTAEEVKAALAKIGAAAKPLDVVFVMLIGHGSWDGTDAKFNLLGPDLTAAEWAGLLKPIPSRVVFVNTTPSSAPFVKALAAPNRVVITATQTPEQKYDSAFADAFVRALGSSEADIDKDGRVSMWEAFAYASRLVRQGYEQRQAMQPEHAMLDDDGDGVGRLIPGDGKDGTLSSLTFIDAVAALRPADPEVQQMALKQESLLIALDVLTKKKDQMKPDEYQPQWEALIIELATVSHTMRERIK